MTTGPLRRLAAVEVEVPSPSSTAELLADLIDFVRLNADPDGTEHLATAAPYGRQGASRALSLRPGDGLRLRQLEFEVADGTLDELARHLDGVGVDHQRTSGDAAAGLTLRDPWGVELLCRPPETDPGPPLAGSEVRPRRLGHVNAKVPDAGAAVDFYTSALGLLLSERVGDLLAFVRIGSEHHNLGFRSGAATSNLHHVAFELHGWETYRVLCDRIAERGHVVEYGPGRHGPGRNLFVYVVDPSSGLRLELFADMVHIEHPESYVPIEWENLDRARTMNRWGPGPPSSFLE